MHNFKVWLWTYIIQSGGLKAAHRLRSGVLLSLLLDGGKCFYSPATILLGTGDRTHSTDWVGGWMNPQASWRIWRGETLAPGRNFYLFGQRFKFTVIGNYSYRLLSQCKLNTRYLLLLDFPPLCCSQLCISTRLNSVSFSCVVRQSVYLWRISLLIL